MLLWMYEYSIMKKSERRERRKRKERKGTLTEAEIGCKRKAGWWRGGKGARRNKMFRKNNEIRRKRRNKENQAPTIWNEARNVQNAMRKGMKHNGARQNGTRIRRRMKVIEAQNGERSGIIWFVRTPTRRKPDIKPANSQGKEATWLRYNSDTIGSEISSATKVTTWEVDNARGANHWVVDIDIYARF